MQHSWLKVILGILFLISLTLGTVPTILTLVVCLAWIYPTRILKRKKEFLLLGVVCLLCLVLLSLFGLFYRPDWRATHWTETNTQFDPELGWSLAPNQSVTYGIVDIKPDGTKNVYPYTMSSNSIGLRSPELNNSQPQILIVGDSVVWGYGIGDNATIPYFLGQRMPKYQVLNLGVSGYSIDQYYLFLRRYINQTNPKYVILFITAGNDLVGTERNDVNEKSKPLFHWKGDQLVLTNTPLSRNSCFNLWSSSWLLTYAQEHFPWIHNLQDFLCKEEVLSTEEREKVIPALLKEIKGLAKQHNATIFYVITPNYKDFPFGTEEIRYFDKTLRDMNVTYINLYNSFMKNVPYRDLDYLYMDIQQGGGHYNAVGSDYVARILKVVIDELDTKTQTKLALNTTQMKSILKSKA